MYVPTFQEILDGVARTLEMYVIPALDDRFAKGQAEGVATQLRGLTAYWSLVGEEARTENAEMRTMLEKILPTLQAAESSSPIGALVQSVTTALESQFEDDQSSRSPTSLAAEGNVLGQVMVNLTQAFNTSQLDPVRDRGLVLAQVRLREITLRQADRRDPKLSNDEVTFHN